MIFNDKEYMQAVVRAKKLFEEAKSFNPYFPMPDTRKEFTALVIEIDAYELNLPSPCFLYTKVTHDDKT